MGFSLENDPGGIRPQIDAIGRNRDSIVQRLKIREQDPNRLREDNNNFRQCLDAMDRNADDLYHGFNILEQRFDYHICQAGRRINTAPTPRRRAKVGANRAVEIIEILECICEGTFQKKKKGLA